MAERTCFASVWPCLTWNLRNGTKTSVELASAKRPPTIGQQVSNHPQQKNIILNPWAATTWFFNPLNRRYFVFTVGCVDFRPIWGSGLRLRYMFGWIRYNVVQNRRSKMGVLQGKVQVADRPGQFLFPNKIQSRFAATIHTGQTQIRNISKQEQRLALKNQRRSVKTSRNTPPPNFSCCPPGRPQPAFFVP